MEKIDVVLDLVREGKITNEQAKILLSSNDQKQEPAFVPYPISPYPWTQPWYNFQPYVVTC